MSEWLIRLAILIFKALSRLPRPALKGISAVLGPVIYWTAVRRRHTTLRNLELCFPQWSEAERRKVAKLHFRRYVQSFLDRFRFWYGSEQDIRDLCKIKGLENLKSAMGQPLIVLCPHFVGIDGGGLRLQLETPLFSIYARQSSAALNEAMTRGRERFNNAEMLLRTDGIRPAIRRLKQNIPLYFGPDMDLGARDAVFVDFFGVPAATVTSVHRLARMTGAKILPCITRMTEDGYETTYPPVWDNYPSDDEVADTRRMNAYIEQEILVQPADYLWSHRRFKTRPPGEKSLY